MPRLQISNAIRILTIDVRQRDLFSPRSHRIVPSIDLSCCSCREEKFSSFFPFPSLYSHIYIPFACGYQNDQLSFASPSLFCSFPFYHSKLCPLKIQRHQARNTLHVIQELFPFSFLDTFLETRLSRVFHTKNCLKNFTENIRGGTMALNFGEKLHLLFQKFIYLVKKKRKILLCRLFSFYMKVKYIGNIRMDTNPFS